MTKAEIKERNESVIGIIDSEDHIIIKAEFNIYILCRALTVVSIALLLFAVFFMGSMSYVAFAVFGVLAFLTSLAGFIINKRSEKMEFYVTKQQVVSRTLFGNIRYFPIDEIQLVRLSAPSSLTLASKENKIVACFIKNRKEISRMVNKLAIAIDKY